MKLYVIADDLTGANATSVLLAKEGFKCSSLIDSELVNEKNILDYDVIAISTDSRGITKEEAYAKVKREANRVRHEKPMYTKRIDSTLRGNIGSEIDAMLDTIENSIAIVVPSYPNSQRIAIGGFLLVDSVPLEKTLVSKDPKCPVKNSKVSDIIKFQTKHRVGEIGIDEVLKGSKILGEKIKVLAMEGNKILVIDAVTNEDIDIIARASMESNLNIIAVDPGPYTKSLMKERYSKGKIAQGKKVFFAVGSVSKTTLGQIEYLSVNKVPDIIKANPLDLIDKEKSTLEIERVVNIIRERLKNSRASAIGVVTATREDEVLDFKELSTRFNLDEEEMSIRINRGLAKITELTLEIDSSSIGALYTSGGDVTIEVMKLLEVEGIDIKDEVIPLAVYGRFIGGKYDNMPAITKGGLIGDKKTLAICIDYLLTKTSTEYYIK